MVAITPRWEWRTFGRGFGEAEQKLAHVLTAPQASDEIYVVCERSDLDVTIRDNRLEIKARQDVSDQGLERWAPVFKVPFPIGAIALSTVFDRLGLDLPTMPRLDYDAGAFLRELVAPNGLLTTVHVTKRRSGGRFEDCQVEIADLTFDGEPVRTLGIEHEDSARVMAALATLGLSSRANVNYVHALKKFLSARVGAQVTCCRRACS